MAESRYQPNPLRPYYVPPSIGRETQAIPNATSARSATSTGFSFPDLDYSEYIPEASPSVTGQVKSLLDKALWKYTSVVIAQPFEVAKLILQTRVAQEQDADDAFRGRDDGHRAHDFEQEDDEDEEPNYFSSSAAFGEPTSRSPMRGRRGRPPREGDPHPGAAQTSPDVLSMKNPHSILDALSALSSNSGGLAIWKGTNSTFIYTVLLRTFETFFRSFLAAVFGVADNDISPSLATGISDSTILGSVSPTTTVLIATAATALSALILAPVDAARTRLILTPASQEPRSLLATVRTLSPAYLTPTHLIPITFLTSAIPSFIATSTPLFLKQYLAIDPAMNPTTWSIFTFLGSALDLSIKFPLETVLRRAQIATWTSPQFAPPASQSKRKAIKTIVQVPQAYRGVLPTIWGIMRDEGYSESQRDRTAALMGKAPRRKRKGQGFEGLYRGWRVGLWGLVGIWGTSFVGGLQSGTEAASADAGVRGGKF
ncbi:hypothetical protein LTR70_005000 [Exophiala xenobiotica]|uniref:Uncharacterized protein n=1 Tax=Lithohypha guttulata TaxID=1690604 RepID=A0ABR0KC08_9EURO|nr:hypothetical protein LTR24_004404 [Lithohypha guttulata]KAK5319381.1 hypothetical protein LTR70_005000 [Exophiala xenobiotica]